MKSKSVHAQYPLSIRDAADAIGVTPEALRYFERRGIVSPIRFGRNQCRLYLPEHLAQISASLYPSFFLV